MRTTIASLFMGVMMASAAQAQETPAPVPAPAPPACSAPEFRQLDFWVGEWTFGDGTEAAPPSNSITRDEFGPCAIVEHFRQPGGRPDGSEYIGGSYSMYDPLTGKWRQMWVDNNGTSFQFIGGPVTGQDHIFEFMTTEPIGRGERKAYARMIFEDVQADSFRWRWQSQKPDGTWNDNWVIEYRRKPA